VLVHAAIYEGKAKTVRPKEGGQAEIEFRDDVTAGNGQKHAVFFGKGVLCSRISALLLTYLQSEGIPTHFIRRLTDRVHLVRAVEIIPLEVVVRFQVAGSLEKRTGLPPLSCCDPPVYELYFKRDDLGDPMINEDHVRVLGLATSDELRIIRDLALAAATKLYELLRCAQLALLDLKFEVGRVSEQIYLADEISPDTCRLRDLQTGQVLDKDVFRQNLAELIPTYQEVLRRIEQLPVLQKLSRHPADPETQAQEPQ